MRTALSSGKFPDKWSFSQAMPILEFLMSLRPDFSAVEALGRLSSKYPYEAVRVVRVVFEEDLRLKQVTVSITSRLHIYEPKKKT
jgi:hypothetical protein